MSSPGHDREPEPTRFERLSAGDFRPLERQVAEKRLAWLEEHGYPGRAVWSPATHRVDLRAAFELFFFEYIGLEAADLPVVEESESRLTWLSKNPCRTLDECLQLGLDPREVCRKVYDKPTQLFFSCLDPSVRFVRDYDQIRPHAAHCRESLVRLDLEDLMRQAIAEANAAKAEGNQGYGAVVVMGDRLIARAHDSGTTEGDPSRHGESKAICQAAAALGTSDLSGGLLISTCEPCPMCAGLAVWANLTTVIFGSSIADTAAMGRTRIMVGTEEIVRRSPYTMEVMGGLLKDECDALYR